MSLIEVLGRWNRWGTAELPSGRPREVTRRLTPFLTSPEVVALVGPRRAGKTTVLFQVMDALADAGVSESAFLHINLEEPGLAPDLGTDLLESAYRAWREEIHPTGRGFLFLDEVQCVPGWERWVRARNDTEDVKIFVTGSSSALLSRELGTLLTGRHVRFVVLPLSFQETLAFRGITPPRRATITPPAEVRHALSLYLRWGGFPEIVLADDDQRRETLLKQYFDDVLYRDVALRHEVRDVAALRALAVHLLTHTASLVSYHRLARTLELSLDLVRAYCGHLREAWLLDLLPVWSRKVADRTRNPQKVHAVDTGLRNAVCLAASEDRGHLAETAVHGALVRTEPDGIFYYRRTGEVDFLVRRANATRLLVQVAWDTTDETALARELRSLAEAGRAFRDARRVLVTSTPRKPPAEAHEALPLWWFLLGDAPT